jgi:hypothetical protein
MSDCSDSSAGGTGFPACADRLAGAEASPANLLLLYKLIEGLSGTA